MIFLHGQSVRIKSDFLLLLRVETSAAVFISCALHTLLVWIDDADKEVRSGNQWLPTTAVLTSSTWNDCLYIRLNPAVLNNTLVMPCCHASCCPPTRVFALQTLQGALLLVPAPSLPAPRFVCLILEAPPLLLAGAVVGEAKRQEEEGEGRGGEGGDVPRTNAARGAGEQKMPLRPPKGQFYGTCKSFSGALKRAVQPEGAGEQRCSIQACCRHRETQPSPITVPECLGHKACALWCLLPSRSTA